MTRHRPSRLAYLAQRRKDAKNRRLQTPMIAPLRPGASVFRWFWLLPLLSLLLAACAEYAPTSDGSPAWACPSPTPKPYGESGPVKDEYDCDCDTDPVTGEESCDTCYEYYTIWEQEYPDSGPPFAAPTPFVVKGTSYVLGQRVLIPPVYATVNATRISTIDPDTALYTVSVTWNNPVSSAVPVNYYEQIRLRGIKTPDGRILTDDGWQISDESLALSGIGTLPSAIPPGESTVLLPIAAPDGEPHTVEVQFVRDPAAVAALPTTAVTDVAAPPDPYAPPTPTSPPAPTITPTPIGGAPNEHLQSPTRETVAITWTQAQPAQPDCPYGPGAMTAVDISGGHGIADVPLAAPPGTNRVVQLALAQVGKPYIFGTQGPRTFDCSGLCYWSYGQIGMRIPRGTAGQWPNMRPVNGAQAQPGDLVFFVFGRLGGRVDHVGMVVGDVDGDGTVDMVHAASPALGVRMEYNFLASGSTYAKRLAGFRTVR